MNQESFFKIRITSVSNFVDICELILKNLRTLTILNEIISSKE